MVLCIEPQKIYSPGGCHEIAFPSTFWHNGPRPISTSSERNAGIEVCHTGAHYSKTERTRDLYTVSRSATFTPLRLRTRKMWSRLEAFDVVRSIKIFHFNTVKLLSINTKS
jgi:hypothetical protein